MTGRTLSHYEILDDLGAGGMGVVYRAHDTRLDRDVAIKVLPTDRPLSETARKRFQREALAASALNHPNIITIYEVGSEENTDFIVMEYVRGATLSSLLKKRPLGMAEATRYCVQIADALAKAHASGIIHRDLKPGNIMITEDGLVKVLDFGLAKFDAFAASKDGEGADNDTAVKEFTLTQPGMITGTVAYMSPEQARGERVDARSDIFSFGIVMFEALSRHLPFTGPEFHCRAAQSPLQPAARSGGTGAQGAQAAGGADLQNVREKTGETHSNHGRGGHRVAQACRQFGGWAGDLASQRCHGGHGLPGASSFQENLLAKCLAGRARGGAGGSGGVYGMASFSQAEAGAKRASAQIFQPSDTAYTLYQRARQDLDHWDREGNIDNAIKLGERAVQLDPQSAASYAVLGDAYVLKNQANPDPQWIRMASQYANKAVALDNYLSAAHASLGVVKMESGDTAGAEKELRTAADLDPKNDRPHALLGRLYDKMGKPDDAQRDLNLALKLNK